MDATYPTEEPDLELLRGVAVGETRSFESLYHRYEKRLFRYISTLVQDDGLAGDVLVEVMLAIWNGAREFRGSSKVSTWMIGIARHKAFDAIRRHRRDQEHVPLEEAADLPDPKDGPGVSIEKEELAALTRRALQKLSKEHQEVIQLAFYQELSYQDIAELTGVPVNTVKTRVFYAKQQLRNLLAGLEETGI